MSTQAKTSEDLRHKDAYDEDWEQMFTNPDSDWGSKLQAFRSEHRKKEMPDRCTVCLGPLENKTNDRNPFFCDCCTDWMRNHYPGGVRKPFTVISMDMAHSSILAREDPDYHSKYERPFFVQVGRALIENDGFFIDCRGDECRATYPSGFAGPSHVKKAVTTALQLLSRPPTTPDGDPIEFKVAVHIGTTRIGSLGEPPFFMGCAISGDGINTCCAMSKAAKPAEALLSDSVFEALGMAPDAFEPRMVPLEDRDGFTVRAITAKTKLTKDQADLLSW